ncbi:MAG: hypothetical protein A2521_09190 [Deltaproteobacteria bacterium RIFOXYD12_FULL_57_12]|nr:MAG: hypothetical protein A2521_09190 [Deltaproteobacteria bacterium RIFOXYD12_FULL_57_12]
MRPAGFLLAILLLLGAVNIGLYAQAMHGRRQAATTREMLTITTAALGLTDLCIATEARYTRHPAISDRLAPFMDHPGAFEHFPTGSFWSPPPPSRSLNLATHDPATP